MDIVFGKKWFQKHQSKLLWLLNTPVVKYWFRWVMRIRKHDCPINERIVEILPNNFSIYLGKEGDEYKVKTDFRTHDKYSKRLYFAFKPFWYLLHFFDWAMLDRVEELTKLSFGFSTLTAYPDTGSGSTTVNGWVARQNVDETWATIRAGAGTTSFIDDTTNNLFVGFIQTTGGYTGKFAVLRRSIFTFDTSAIGSSAAISDAVLSLYGASKYYDGIFAAADTVDIYTSTPASNNNLVNADFQELGSTSQSGSPISYTNWSTTGYNAFTFNATGRGNVSKTGISKFGSRNANYDGDNVSPSGNGDNAQYLIKTYPSGTSGTSQDPKLVVTYTTVAPNTNFLQMF